MSTTRQFLTVGLVLGLAAGLFLGYGLAQPGRAVATVPSVAPSLVSHTAVAGVPGAFAASTKGGTTLTASGAAIAYPYFGGSPGVAPDHTILVTGFGQADLKADGSNWAKAQQTALLAALADAKAQADIIATATKLSISGVLSVSASVSPSYGVIPVEGGASGGTPGQPVPPTATGPTAPQTLIASVTIAYRVS